MKDKITLGHRFLQVLKERQVEHFYANPGTEFTALMEAFSKEEPRVLPKPVLVPHENLAVHMAFGSYLASGLPQVVMTHALIGAANALSAVINASRMNIPLLFVAGRTPIQEFAEKGSRDRFHHWAQESYDQGALFREFTKWDYELRRPEQLEEVLGRAFSIMNTPPYGPVFLQLPRELLLQEFQPELVRTEFQIPSQLGVPSPGDLAKLVEMIHSAKAPMILTKTFGSHPKGVGPLEELAEELAIPVLAEHSHYYNLSWRHEMFCGFLQKAHPLYEMADLLICLDMDVPWVPNVNAPSPSAKVVHIGADPLFQKIPMRSHRGDFSLTVDLWETLDVLKKELLHKACPVKMTERRQKVAEVKKTELTSHTFGDTLSEVAKALGESLNDQCVIFNELNLPPGPLDLTYPGSYFRTGSASGLGWGIGAALGYALSQPNKVVISVVGDGAYYLGQPMAAHWFARKHGLKWITLLLNNEGMQSLYKAGTLHFSEFEKVEKNDSPLTSLAPSPHFSQLSQVFGLSGHKVESVKHLKEILPKVIQSTAKNSDQVLLDFRGYHNKI